MPVLEDLYNLLRKQNEAEAQHLATAMEIYVTGSLSVFNNRTNIDIGNRLVCFDIKELGKGLKKIAMLVLQDAVWNRVTVNRAAKRTTWFYLDEMHLLLKEEQTAAYTVEIWKRFRKWGGVPSGLTQNVKDLLASREIENIFEDIYCKGQMSKQGQMLLLQNGSQPIRSSMKRHSRSRKGAIDERRRQFQTPRRKDIIKTGNGVTLEKLPPFPHATLESGTG
jgi:type IV secretory pathway VirB4 component